MLPLPPPKVKGYVFTSVCLSVCLSAEILRKLWTDFDEIFGGVEHGSTNNRLDFVNISYRSRTVEDVGFRLTDIFFLVITYLVITQPLSGSIRCARRRSPGSRVLSAIRRNTFRLGRTLGWRRRWRNRSDDGHSPRTWTRPRTWSLRGTWSADGSLLPGLRTKLLPTGRRPKSHTVSLRYV